ncbi:hypothetical protein B0H11DRAFT_2348043 [Mycena galericulata]|nr:hypothetical protein B0H11DRAFT_2348043 [Mycena galericulata]
MSLTSVNTNLLHLSCVAQNSRTLLTIFTTLLTSHRLTTIDLEVRPIRGVILVDWAAIDEALAGAQFACLRRTTRTDQIYKRSAVTRRVRGLMLRAKAAVGDSIRRDEDEDLLSRKKQGFAPLISAMFSSWPADALIGFITGVTKLTRGKSPGPMLHWSLVALMVIQKPDVLLRHREKFAPMRSHAGEVEGGVASSSYNFTSPSSPTVPTWGGKIAALDIEPKQSEPRGSESRELCRRSRQFVHASRTEIMSQTGITRRIVDGREDLGDNIDACPEMRPIGILDTDRHETSGNDSDRQRPEIQPLKSRRGPMVHIRWARCDRAESRYACTVRTISSDFPKNVHLPLMRKLLPEDDQNIGTGRRFVESVEEARRKEELMGVSATLLPDQSSHDPQIFLWLTSHCNLTLALTTSGTGIEYFKISLRVEGNWDLSESSI